MQAPEGRDFIHLISIKSLASCLAHNKCSVNVCWMSEWVIHLCNTFQTFKKHLCVRKAGMIILESMPTGQFVKTNKQKNKRMNQKSQYPEIQTWD